MERGVIQSSGATVLQDKREADTSARALIVGIEPVGLSSEAVRHWRRIRLRRECPVRVSAAFVTKRLSHGSTD